MPIRKASTKITIGPIPPANMKAIPPVNAPRLKVLGGIVAQLVSSAAELLPLLWANALPTNVENNTSVKTNPMIAIFLFILIW